MLGFRVWDPDYNQFRCERYCTVSINGEIGYFDKDGSFVRLDNKYICLQSTGVKDKNDKEIYCGDILEIDHEISFHESKVAYFCVDEPFDLHYHWDLSIESTQFGEDSFLVIGNIYENPELLEKIKC